jgi:uncharacterized membrane protein (UPF0127 family)
VSDAVRRHSLEFPLWRSFFLASLALAFFVALGRAAESGLERLEIVTTTGTHVFQVEAAKTPAQRAKGLMYRRSMPRDHGMLFDFHMEQTVLMWMKNTYIPLDMIFVSREGRVVSVAQDAEPLSEGVISSGKPAYAVIELNAGAARRIGLAAGDSVRHPIFSR